MRGMLGCGVGRGAHARAWRQAVDGQLARGRAGATAAWGNLGTSDPRVQLWQRLSPRGGLSVQSVTQIKPAYVIVYKSSRSQIKPYVIIYKSVTQIKPASVIIYKSSFAFTAARPSPATPFSSSQSSISSTVGSRPGGENCAGLSPASDPRDENSSAGERRIWNVSGTSLAALRQPRTGRARQS